MRLLLGSLAIALAPAALTTPALADETWFADFDEAVAAAEEQGKDLFVDFTGSDWCGWCIKLDGEVFEHDAFLDPIRKDYVLVKLDFPSSDEVKALVPDPERNQELSDEYGIRGFPTVLLMRADGTAYAKTGYQAGGPEKYVAHVNEIRTEGLAALESVKKVVASFEAATTPEAQRTAMANVLDTLADLSEGSPFIGQLTPLARESFTLDPENAHGLKLRAVRSLLAAGVFDAEIQGAVTELDPRNEEGLLEQSLGAQMRAIDSEEAVADFVEAIGALEGIELKDQELAFSLYGNAAMFSNRYLGDEEGAKKYARKALAIGAPEGSERFTDMLREIVGEDAVEEAVGGES